jgi:hypothetical protein
MTKILDEEFEVPKYLLEVGDLIENELVNTKLDRRSAIYKQWKKKMNELLNLYNTMAGFAAYSNLR